MKRVVSAAVVVAVGFSVAVTSEVRRHSDSAWEAWRSGREEYNRLVVPIMMDRVEIRSRIGTDAEQPGDRDRLAAVAERMEVIRRCLLDDPSAVRRVVEETERAE